MSVTTFRHYSLFEFTLDREVKYDQSDCMKPVGFWISVESNGDGWSDWCRDNDYFLECLTTEYEVVLSENASILTLKNASDLDEFTTEYGCSDPYDINWYLVSNRYDGIVIAPYIWSRRMTRHTSWYYGWDCASGCVWNLSVIKEVKLIKEIND